MKYIRLSVLAYALFLLLACSAADVNDKCGPEYYDGRTMGETYAKKDAARLKCTTNKPIPSRWSREHNPELEEQGRSEMFKRGFYGGYSKILRESWEMKCD